MNRIIFTVLIPSSLIFTNDISGVTYFEYSDDAFSINRTYFTYKKNVSDELNIDNVRSITGELSTIKLNLVRL